MVTVGRIYQNFKEYQKDNYYLQDTRSVEKVGDGWSLLGLENVQVDGKIYQALAQGKDPRTGELLSQHFEREHRQGYDITFSPHKSLTVGALSDPTLKEVIEKAHQQAVQDVLNYLQSELAQTRQDGQPVQTGNILALKVDHSVNREGDPHMHTHVVVFNVTYNSETGKWQAIHSDAFKSNFLEKIYENQLANYLKQSGLAVEWVRSDSGKSEYAAIAGVPERAVEVFSERARQVDEYVKAHYSELKEKYPNATDGQLKEIAAIETRKEKESITQEQLQANIEQKLSSVNVSKEDIVRSIREASEKVREVKEITGVKEMNARQVLEKAVSTLSEHEMTFTKQDLYKTALTISRGDVSLNEIKQAINKAMKDNTLLSFGNHTIHTGNRSIDDEVLGTRQLYEAQKRIEGLVISQQNSINPVMAKDEVLKKISEMEKRNGFSMTESQKAAITEVLTTSDRFIAVQGYAGVGKTTSMEAIVSFAKEKGYNVVGIAETNVAVNQMRAAGVTHATTVTKFLNQSKWGNMVSSNTILVVDESSFVGTKNFENICNLAYAKGARVSFWGDKNQLPPVAAGEPFRELQEKGIIKTVEMKDIIRQKDENLKQAVYEIIEKNVEKAMSRLDVREVQDREQAIREITREYMARDGYKNYIVVTQTNEDKDKINQTIREQLKQEGKIKGKEIQITTYTQKNLSASERLNPGNYERGDILVVQKSGAGVSVGKQVEVVGIGQRTGTVLVRYEKAGATVEKTIDIREHGDKFAVYKPQNITIAVGDKVIFTKNEKFYGGKVYNSEIAYVKKINSNGSITFQLGNREVTTHSRFFTYGYASTVYKSQGKTTQGSIYYVPTEKGNPSRYQEAYVALSRAKSNALVYTDNKAELQKQMCRVQEKTSPSKWEKQLDEEIKKLENDLKKNPSPEKSTRLEKLKSAKEHLKVEQKQKETHGEKKARLNVGLKVYQKGVFKGNTFHKREIYLRSDGVARRQVKAKNGKVEITDKFKSFKGEKTTERTYIKDKKNLLTQRTEGLKVSKTEGKNGTIIKITAWREEKDRFTGKEKSSQITYHRKINVKETKEKLEQKMKDAKKKGRKDLAKAYKEQIKALDKLEKKADEKAVQKYQKAEQKTAQKEQIYGINEKVKGNEKVQFSRSEKDTSRDTSKDTSRDTSKDTSKAIELSK